jgi:hypothetical protein
MQQHMWAMDLWFGASGFSFFSLSSSIFMFDPSKFQGHLSIVSSSNLVSHFSITICFILNN